MSGHGGRRRTSRRLAAFVAAVLTLAVAAPAAQAGVTIGDVQVAEADTDTTATFTVTRTEGILAGPATIHFSTADGSARAPADYGAIAGELHFGSLALGGTQV